MKLALITTNADPILLLVDSTDTVVSVWYNWEYSDIKEARENPESLNDWDIQNSEEAEELNKEYHELITEGYVGERESGSWQNPEHARIKYISN